MGAAAVSAVDCPSSRTSLDRQDFRAVYEGYFHVVERWLRAMGTPLSDLEDLAQEVFLVVRRKLAGFDGRNLQGWLFQITYRTASDHRRRAWFKHLFSRRSEVPLEDLPWSGAGPAETLERKEAREMLAAILSRMSEKRRTAFILFEIEGFRGEEIAEALDIPVDTVWTRLHHARQEFLSRLEELQRWERKP